MTDYQKEFKDLKGLTILKIEGGKDQEFIDFYTKDFMIHMHHSQDCCESVYIEDIVGDLNDLLNIEIVEAYENYEAGESQEYGDSSTWTFYRISTIKGTVTIRWFGSSNGYYSETASTDWNILK